MTVFESLSIMIGFATLMVFIVFSILTLCKKKKRKPPTVIGGFSLKTTFRGS